MASGKEHYRETWLTPAKVNLSLRVHGRDQDGYHPIRSLAQTLEWCDELQITEEPGAPFRLETRTEPGLVGADHLSEQPENQNLVYQAVEKWGQQRDRPLPSWQVELRKNIPIGAGLGGGSSNAAGMLLALVEDAQESTEKIVELAQELGADIPFLLQGGTAWLAGRGEQVTPIQLTADEWALVVVCPPFSLATEEVYLAWDRLGEPDGPNWSDSSLPPELRAYSPLTNDLYPAAVSLRPELEEWRAELSQQWGREVRMSGSGPALFGLFSQYNEALDALNHIPEEAGTIRAATLRKQGAARVERYE